MLYRTKTKTRLLVVGPLPPPVGGVETVTAAVLESPVLGRFERTLCDLTKRRPKHAAGRFDVGNFWWATIHFARMSLALLRFKPDVVYMPLTGTWSGFLRDAVLATMAKTARARVVGHLHGGWFDRILLLNGWKGRIVRHALRRFDSLLVLGNYWHSLLLRYNFGGGLHIVPPTFRADIGAAAMSFRRDYATRHSTGLYVGHVGVGKGVLDLLQAFAPLRHADPNARLVLCGPPQFRGDWEAAIDMRDRLDLGSAVEFTGPLQGEALFQRFRMADYFVLPSYAEGLPVVLLEAGLFGLPVIATPVGAIPDVLGQEINALLVKPGDVGALQEALRRLMTDRALRERLGRQLQQDVARFHPDLVCHRIAEEIESVVHQGYV